MKKFSRFSLYKPEKSALPDYVLFLQSAEGVDWYDAQQQFAKATMKIVYDESGIICSAAKDASGLWPVGCFVAEIDNKKIPDNFLVEGRWQYVNGKITEVPVDYAVTAKEQKILLLEKATSVIAPLQDAVELEMATEDEAALLTEWKKYRVLLSRLSVDAAPDIDWPQAPQA